MSSLERNAPSDMKPRSVLLPKMIFTAAMKLAPGSERDAFLTEACYDSPDVKASVEKLIAASDTTGLNPLDQVIDKIDLDATPIATSELTGDPNGFDGAIDVATHPMIGPYKLLESIGHGGMGVVYMAEQQEPIKRKVALKLIRPGMDSREVIARFEAERQALAMMDHPNIAKVFDAGTTENFRPYFVMELVHGKNIIEYCQLYKLSLVERLKLFIDICQAVQHAHQKGIIHRDIKPSNILVSQKDGKAIPKVIDFGVAKALNQELTERTLFTQFAQLIGTPAYMSPEQAVMNHIDVDTRSDIYSLGVLLYELLTGNTPFNKESLSKLSYEGLRKVLQHESPLKPSAMLSTIRINEITTVASHQSVDLRKLKKTLRGELDLIVMTALEKDRELRYKSAIEFGNDVERYLKGEPIIACPPSIKYRFRKFCQRHWMLLSFFLITTISLLAGGGIAVSQMFRAIAAEGAATERERETNNLLEAARLHQMLVSFRNRDFTHISTLHTPEIEADENDSYLMPYGKGSVKDLLIKSGTPEPIRTFTHGDSVKDFSLSSDKKYLATACEDGSAYLWKIETGELVRTFGPHMAPVDSVAFAPDPNLLVTGSQDGTLLVWHLDEAKPIKLLATLPSGIETIKCSPNGSYLLAGARYTETRIWDENLNEILKFKNDHRHESFLFSQDGTKVYIPTRESISVWELPGARKIKTLGTAPLVNIREMAWVGKTNDLIVAADRFTEDVVLISPKKGKVLTTLTTNSIYPQRFGVNSDQSRLIAVYDDGQCRVFNINSIEKGGHRTLPVSQFQAHQIQFQNDTTVGGTAAKFLNKNEFMTAGHDGKVHLWSLGQTQTETILIPPKRLVSLLPTTDEELVYFYEGEKQPTRVSPQGKASTIRDVAANDNILAVGSISTQGWYPVLVNGKVQIRSLQTGETLGTTEIPIDLKDELLISRDGNRIAVCRFVNEISVWETTDQWKTNRHVVTIEEPVNDGAVFADNGKSFIFDSNGKFIVDVNLENPQQRKRYEAITVTSLTISKDYRYLAGSAENGFRVWDRKTGQLVLNRNATSRVSCLSFTDEDRVLLTGHRNGQIHAYHIPTGEALGTLYKPQSVMGKPESINFLQPSGRIVVHYHHVQSGRHSSKVLLLGPSK